MGVLVMGFHGHGDRGYFFLGTYQQMGLMKIVRSVAFLAILSTGDAWAEKWTYRLEQFGMPETALKTFDIRWQSSSEFRFGTMERNLYNQANLNFLHSVESPPGIRSCQVYLPPSCTADGDDDCQLNFQEKGHGLFFSFRRTAGTTKVQLECSLPQTEPRSQEYVWPDPGHQFLCVTDLFRPEERPGMAQLTFFGLLFEEHPTVRTDFLVLSAVSVP